MEKCTGNAVFLVDEEEDPQLCKAQCIIEDELDFEINISHLTDLLLPLSFQRFNAIFWVEQK